MAMHPAHPRSQTTGAEQLLFTPGPRLGWVFRDRSELATPFPEPQPTPQAIGAQAAVEVAAAGQAWRRAWKWAGLPSALVAAMVIALEGCGQAETGQFSIGTLLTALVLCSPGLAYAGWQWQRYQQWRAIDPGQEYQQALDGWSQRAAWHQHAELTRLSGQPEWGSVTIPAGRTDIFGGTAAGWQALVAVHGASLLAQSPLLVIDLTGQDAASTLMALARRTGTEAATWRLPQDLGRSGLLSEMSPAQLADAIAEALHAGDPGHARTDRAIDARVLRQLASALAGGKASPQRLAAAVRAALGYPAPDGLLSAAERELLAGSLFPAAYRDQVMASLVRLDAVLAELASYAAAGWPARPGRLTCLATSVGPRSATTEVLTALIGQWLTVQVATAPASPPAVIIAGADDLTRAHAEHLAGACGLRRVPVTLLFRHLRDAAVPLVGGGVTAFMRLGNHAEAEQAASYLGRQHSFVVSSYTATHGGSETSTYGGSEGYGTGDSASNARTHGWLGNGFPGFHEASSGGRTRTDGTSTSQNWSQSWSGSDGTSWSDTQTRQRVYEYAVEPTTLQNLPEYALLLADRTGGTLTMRAVECDPAIITMPGVSTAPLPPPGSITYDSGPPLMHDGPPAGPSIPAPPQYTAGWQEPPAEAPQPAQPPEEQPPPQPWWLRNQPSGPKC
jgi:hypothetical protein